MKSMKKSICLLSALLAVLMLLSVLAITPVGAETEITSVSLSVSPPMANGKFNDTLPQCIEEDKYELRGLSCVDSKGHIANEFVAGESYTYNALIVAKSGYRFKVSQGQPDLPVYINNEKKQAEVFGTYDPAYNIGVTYTFFVAPESGTTGGCNWEYNKNTHFLTISGNGRMDDYAKASSTPWYSFRYEIWYITIDDGVEYIGKNAFRECLEADQAIIPSTVTEIGECAFMDCSELDDIIIGEGVKSIGDSAFLSTELTMVYIPDSVTTLGSYCLGFYENKDLYIYTRMEPFAVFCSRGTAAEAYANKNNLQCFAYVKIGDCSVSGIKTKTYNGKAQTQNITVKDGTKTLVKGTDYNITYKNNKNAGTAKMIIEGAGDYYGTVTKTFKIYKAKNPITVTAKKTVNANAKKKTTIKKAVTVKKAQGKVTYKTNNKKITVKNGTMTVAKGLKKGKTYKVKVTIKAAGNKNYNSLSKTITVKIKIK